MPPFIVFFINANGPQTFQMKALSNLMSGVPVIIFGSPELRTLPARCAWSVDLLF